MTGNEVPCYFHNGSLNGQIRPVDVKRHPNFLPVDGSERYHRHCWARQDHREAYVYCCAGHLIDHEKIAQVLREHPEFWRPFREAI